MEAAFEDENISLHDMICAEEPDDEAIDYDSIESEDECTLKRHASTPLTRRLPLERTPLPERPSEVLKKKKKKKKKKKRKESPAPVEETRRRKYLRLSKKSHGNRRREVHTEVPNRTPDETGATGAENDASDGDQSEDEERTASPRAEKRSLIYRGMRNGRTRLWDLLPTPATDSLIKRGRWPSVMFPVLNSLDVDVCTRYVPRKYDIQSNDVVATRVAFRGSYVAPNAEAAGLSREQCEERHMQRFAQDPVYYMALEPAQVYGITQYDLMEESERFAREYATHPDSGEANSSRRRTKKTKTSSKSKGHEDRTQGTISRMWIPRNLSSVLEGVQRTYARAVAAREIPPLTVDGLFPYTRIEIDRGPTDTYHTESKRMRRTRIIPIYMLPFLVRFTGLKRTVDWVINIDLFGLQLREFHERHPEFSDYGPSFYQLDANKYAILETAVEQDRTTNNTHAGYRHRYLQMASAVLSERRRSDKTRHKTKTAAAAQQKRINALERENTTQKRENATQKQRNDELEQRLAAVEQSLSAAPPRHRRTMLVLPSSAARSGEKRNRN